MFEWFKQQRRRKLIERPFPDHWVDVLQRNVAHYAHLTSAEQAKLREKIRVFVAEKNWEGCGGLIVTDEIKVTIAAQACLLVLGFENEYFEAMKSILVYPDTYIAPDQTTTKDGVVLEGDEAREGETWHGGSVVLSWVDALVGGRRESDGNNLVLHEFAHQLDMQNGHEMDGTPSLNSLDQYLRWQETMKAEYERLVEDCQRGRPTLLDCYGTTDMAEFFAVGTESFFEQPCEMSNRHLQLYRVFREYFRQDPAARLCSKSGWVRDSPSTTG